MQMYDAGKIIPGLIIFLAIAGFPLFYNQGVAGKAPEPKLDTPAIKAMGDQKQCVEPKAFMRPEHMKLLNAWRDKALRDGDRVYVSTTGKRYTINLQNTCMTCHKNKKEFCDSCHNYMAVVPYCWDCHIQPKEGLKAITVVAPVVEEPAPAEGEAAAAPEGESAEPAAAEAGGH
jgi:hypothetical protein